MVPTISFAFAVFLICFLPNVWCSSYEKVPVRFSPHRGFFNSPISIELEPPKDWVLPAHVAVVIKYTVNTAIAAPPLNPSLSAGLTYSAPFTLDKTALVKAIAYQVDSKNLKTVYKTSNLTTHTYIFTADVLRQGEMNQSQANKYLKESAIFFIRVPSVSINSQSYYPTETDRVNRPEPGEIEWLDPLNDDQHFHMPMVYDRRGGSSRILPKKQLKIEFNDDTLPGDGELDFSQLFHGFDNGFRSATKFKKFTLRVSNDFVFWRDTWPPILYIRGIWNDMLMQELGCVVPHSRLVHHYFNNQYMGILSMREIMDQHFFQEYLGGDGDDYEDINNGQVQNDLKVSHVYDAMRTSYTYLNLDKWVDWNSFFAFHISIHYTGNFDVGSTHNWYMGGPIYQKGNCAACRYGKLGGFKFYMHDNDVQYVFPTQGPGSVCDSIGYGARCPIITGENASTLTVDPMGGMFNALVGERHPEFMLKFQDAQQRFFINADAPLNIDGNRARFDRIYNTFDMNMTILPELIRWGDGTRSCAPYGGVGCFNVGGFYQSTWLNGFNAIKDTWTRLRHPYLLTQYRNMNWLNAIAAPNFSVANGAILKESDATVKITKNALPGSRLVYTTNGEDPRLVGGAINSAATSSSADSVDVPLTSTTVIKARVFSTNNNAWSPLNQVTINVNQTAGCVLCNNLIISEFSYHPKRVPGAKDPESTFVELKNVGSSPLVLTNALITPLNYRFPVLTLNPGQFWVIALYYEDFKRAYGVYPNDTFSGRLGKSKDGDSFQIVDQVGRLVGPELKYAGGLPWSELADGIGFTTVANAKDYSRLAALKNDDSLRPFYRYSTTLNGSPFADDPEPTNWNQRKIPLKFSYISFEKHWIEFTNPSSQALDISQWAVVEGWKVKEVHTIDNGTVIPAGATFKVKLNEKLERKHNSIILFRKDTTLNAFTGDYLEYAISDNEMAFRR